MARAVKKGTNFFPVIITKGDVLGDASMFTTYAINLETGATVANGGSGTFTEIMQDDNANVGDTNGAAAIGDSTITMAGASTLVDGDTFDDGAGNLYYITSLSGNTIGIKGKLKAAIADGTTLETVGNTGMYKVEYNIADTAECLITIEHPDFIPVPMKYIISDNVLDDIAVANTTRFDALDTAISTITGGGAMTGVA